MRDSRRARIVLAVLLAIATVFVLVDLRGGADPARDAGATTVGPLERAVSSITRPIGDFFGSIGRIRSNERTIDELQARNDELETQLRELDSDTARVEQLDALLGLAGQARFRTVPAQVVAYGPTQGFAFTVTIDVGARDGVSVDQTVINGQGLVGRITSVGQGTSTVLLAIDPTSSLGARLAGTRQIGIVNGQGSAPMELQLLDPLAPLREGDALVTFGARGSPFVPGVPIGTVTSVEGTPGSLTRVAEVDPYVDFTALDIVGVVLGRPATDPRDSLIPPKPARTPTPASTPAPSPTPTGAPATTPAPTGGSGD